MTSQDRGTARIVRKARIRKRLKEIVGRHRLTVFRSGKHIYAQIIDDASHKTIVSAGTVKKGKTSEPKSATAAAAKKVGEEIGRKALEKNILSVKFDRNGYIYHGRVKALADAARATGLKF